MRSTFNILFYVNKSKEKNGVVPVMGRVTINGTQSQFSCKKTIPLDMWDVKGNCAKGRSKEALQINRELDNIKAQIIKHYQHLSDREAFVTAEMVRNSYQGFGSEYETLLSAFDKDIANQKKRVGKDRSASTLWAMERSRKDVAEFIQSHYRRTTINLCRLSPCSSPGILGSRHEALCAYKCNRVPRPPNRQNSECQVKGTADGWLPLPPCRGHHRARR